VLNGFFSARSILIMTLKIFLDDKSFHCLKESIPPGSRSKSIIEKAVHLDLFGSNAVLSCEEAEARNLLLYAGHCPGVIASIHNAFRAAGLTFTTPDISGEGLASPLRRQRLSQHPLMSYRGHRTWPPEWTWLSGTYNRHPDGEAGMLEDVRLSAVNDSAILLTMSYGGGRYISQLTFDDPNFCHEICELLKHHYGWLIRNIGELDVP
jgi:hypothetical protein